ncbi:MAG: leucine-rich repeat protein [Clostridium sp.]|nr:leucine-rich repeat protein [Clostridium sp.]
MKKFLSLFLSVVMLLSITAGIDFSAYADTYTDWNGIEYYISGDFTYYLESDGTARIASYDGSNKNLVIPSTIDGYTVTVIGDQYGYFGGEICSDRYLVSVVIPDTVECICGAAFRMNENLTKVTIPNSVKYIDWDAFNGCKSLTKVTIPNSVEYIGADAFYGCKGLTSIVLPDSISKIENCSFYNCTSLKSVTIGKNVTSIGYRAFGNCKSLTNVTLPDSVKTIEAEAFYNCTGLKSVTIGKKIKTIRSSAFYCRNLKDVYYKGTKQQWNDVNIEQGNDYLLNSTIHYSGCTTHKWNKGTVTKATTSKNGSIVKKCSVCGAKSTTTIYYPKTITLSTTSYTYDNKAKKPSVTVKDSKGNKISTSNYTVSYASGRKKVGKYTVTIKFKGNYSGTVKKTFTIKPKVSPSSKTLYVGATQKLTVSSSNKTITYSSSNKSVATVSKKGVITAKKKGTATITVKSNGISNTVKITVKNPGISLNKSSVSVYKGNTVTLKATTTPSGSKVTWSSSNKKVATVSGGKVKGVGKGTATITASIKYKGKTYKKTCKVTVNVKPSKEKTAAYVEYLLRGNLKNPSSFRLNNIIYSGNTVWVWYSAVNGFGGRTDGFASGYFSKEKVLIPGYYNIDCDGGYIVCELDAYKPKTFTGYLDISKVNKEYNKISKIHYSYVY